MVVSGIDRGLFEMHSPQDSATHVHEYEGEGLELTCECGETISAFELFKPEGVMGAHFEDTISHE